MPFRIRATVVGASCFSFAVEVKASSCASFDDEVAAWEKIKETGGPQGWQQVYDNSPAYRQKEPGAQMEKNFLCVWKERSDSVGLREKTSRMVFLPQAAVKGRQTLLHPTQTCREVDTSRQQASSSACFTAHTVHACAMKMSKCLSHTQRNAKIWVMLRKKIKKLISSLSKHLQQEKYHNACKISSNMTNYHSTYATQKWVEACEWIIFSHAHTWFRGGQFTSLRAYHPQRVAPQLRGS